MEPQQGLLAIFSKEDTEKSIFLRKIFDDCKEKFMMVLIKNLTKYKDHFYDLTKEFVQGKHKFFLPVDLYSSLFQGLPPLVDQTKTHKPIDCDLDEGFEISESSFKNLFGSTKYMTENPLPIRKTKGDVVITLEFPILVLHHYPDKDVVMLLKLVVTRGNNTMILYDPDYMSSKTKTLAKRKTQEKSNSDPQEEKDDS